MIANRVKKEKRKGEGVVVKIFPLLSKCTQRHGGEQEERQRESEIAIIFSYSVATSLSLLL